MEGKKKIPTRLKQPRVAKPPATPAAKAQKLQPGERAAKPGKLPSKQAKAEAKKRPIAKREVMPPQKTRKWVRTDPFELRVGQEAKLVLNHGDELAVFIQGRTGPVRPALQCVVLVNKMRQDMSIPMAEVAEAFVPETKGHTPR